MPQEQMNTNKYDKSVDIFAFGATLYEIITLEKSSV